MQLSKKQILWIKIGLIVLVTLIIYFPAIDGEFIWDDDEYVSKNLLIRNLNDLLKIWFYPGMTPQYYPLVFTSYALEYQLWGLNPIGFHITNISLHILNSLLLWKVLSILKIPGRFFAALLFAVHPLQVESVAWISERKNVLSMFFMLLATKEFLTYVQSKANHQKSLFSKQASRYWLSFIFYICALLSKTVSAMMPAALLIIIFQRKTNKEKIHTASLLIPFFMMSGLFSFFTVYTEKVFVGASGMQWDFNFLERVLIASKAILFYFSKAIWPHPLIFNYEKWSISAQSIIDFTPTFFLIFIAALMIWLSYRGKRGPITAGLVYIILLFPALGFFDVYPFRFSFVADHFSYMANAAVFTFISAVILFILDQVSFRLKFIHFVVYFSIAAPLCVLTWKQSHAYENLDVLWNDTLQKNPDSILANHNIGISHLNAREYEQAVPYFSKSIKIDPSSIESKVGLGVTYLKLKMYSQAETQLTNAISLNENAYDAWAYLGDLYYRRGQFDKAIYPLEKTLELNPNFIYANTILGGVYIEQNKLPKALFHLNQTIRMWPWHAESLVLVGDLYLKMNNQVKAEESYMKAFQTNSNDIDVLKKLARGLEQTNKNAEFFEVTKKLNKLASK